MSFTRHMGALLFADGIEELRAGKAYVLLRGEVVDLTGMSPMRRLAIEHCLGIIQGSRTYSDLVARVSSEGDLAMSLARVPVGTAPSSGELSDILRDIVWRRGLRDGCEVLDTEIVRRWFIVRISMLQHRAPQPQSARLYGKGAPSTDCHLSIR